MGARRSLAGAIQHLRAAVSVSAEEGGTALIPIDAMGSGEGGAQPIRVEGAVGDEPAAAHFRPQSCAGLEVVALARREREGERTTERIDEHRHLRVEAALGATHRLGLLAAGRITQAQFDQVLEQAKRNYKLQKKTFRASARLACGRA